MKMFSLTHEQSTAALEWELDHGCTVEYMGAIGGSITYSFTQTGIGMVQKVKCSCGAELDLTEYDTW